MSTKSALILGATGQTGGKLLLELLASPHFSRVGEYGRRLTPLDALPADTHSKLEQKVIDYEKLDEAGLGSPDAKWDVVFITLGTTRKAAGSDEAFEKIDREYVINAARAARVEGHPQLLVYLSGMLANPSSKVLLMRSKGLAELGLGSIGYDDMIVFRPAFLAGATRAESRPGETITGAITGLVSKFYSGVEIQITILAKAMRIAATLGSVGLPSSAKAGKEGPEGGSFTTVPNNGAIGLAATEV